jgi:hypothetical protein
VRITKTRVEALKEEYAREDRPDWDQLSQRYWDLVVLGVEEEPCPYVSGEFRWWWRLPSPVANLDFPIS